MGKSYVDVSVSITLYAETEKEKIIEKAKNVFKEVNPKIDIDDNLIYISWDERAETYYEAPVYYTRNGDGYPGCYEEYIIWDEDDIRPELQSWFKELEFEIEEVHMDKKYPEEREW